MGRGQQRSVVCLQRSKFLLQRGNLVLGVGNLAGAHHLRQVRFTLRDSVFGCTDILFELVQLFVDELLAALYLSTCGTALNELTNQLVGHRLRPHRVRVDDRDVHELGAGHYLGRVAGQPRDA